MTKSVIVWIYVSYFCYFLQPVCSGTTYTSKACYGSDPPCTRYHLRCNFSQKIAIHDAYYTNNTECAQTGLSSCGNFSADSVAEYGYHRFNNTEMVSLYMNCSTKRHCVYRAPRRNAILAFSVVKYNCNEGLGEPDEEAGTDVGAAVGGVVAAVVAVVIIVIVTMWYLRKRRDSKDEKSSKDLETLRKNPDISQSHCQEIDDSQTRGRSSNYDYATAEGMPDSPNRHTYLTIEPITGPNVQHNLATSSKEDDYDHIGDKPSALSSNYDTTASVAQSLATRANSREDDYGYNRLQETLCTKTVQNDYDTTATAGKAVAQLGKNDDKTPSSPYDTAGKIGDRSGDYAVAGPMRYPHM